jgi:hypothetical protein
MKPDINPLVDEGENTAIMEPLLIGEGSAYREELTELAVDLAARKGICEIHRRFGELLPDELLIVEDPNSGEQYKLEPGELRKRHVQVGDHVAISPGALSRFLDRFESVYSGLGNAATIVSAAAAHHRLLWIHPFLDGNGRVARLMSHSMLRDAAIWTDAAIAAKNHWRSLPNFFYRPALTRSISWRNWSSPID